MSFHLTSKMDTWVLPRYVTVKLLFVIVYSRHVYFTVFDLAVFLYSQLLLIALCTCNVLCFPAQKGTLFHRLKG